MTRGAIDNLAPSRRPTRALSTIELPATTVFETDLGWMSVVATSDCLVGLAFGDRSPAVSRRRVEAIGGGHSIEPSHAAAVDVDALVAMLKSYAAGEPVEFSEVPINVAPLTPFGRRVIAACRAVPWGETRSYGELAAACGRPRAARAVGSVMARNQAPLVAPCHRVLGAGGRLGGYSAPQGLAMKRRLLALESG